MTAEELQTLSRLRELAAETEDLEAEQDYHVVLSACRNFPGCVEMTLHDGSLLTILDLLVKNTSDELDELVQATPARQGFADQFRSLQAKGVAAYRRVLEEQRG